MGTMVRTEMPMKVLRDVAAKLKNGEARKYVGDEQEWRFFHLREEGVKKGREWVAIETEVHTALD